MPAVSATMPDGEFEGFYDAVRRYATRWAEGRRKDPGGDVAAFILLMFRPGEASQFDWSHEASRSRASRCG